MKAIEIPDKLIQKESRKVNSVVLVIALLFSIWLFIDLRMKYGLDAGEPIGRVTYKVKEVERKFGSHSIWQDIETSSNIYNYDTVRTDAFSKITVELKDKTEIQLEANSMVVFNMNNNSLDLNFIQGSIRLNSLNTDVKLSKGSTIRSGGSKISLAKGQVKVNKESESVMDINVIDGKVELNKGDTTEEIGKNEELKLRGEKVKKVKKAIRLLYPISSQYILTSMPKQTIRLEWEGDLEAYSLEVYKIGRVREKIISKTVQDSSYSPELSTGMYQWYLTNPEKTEVQSDTFYIVDDNPVKQLTPSEADNFLYTDKPPLILVSWRKNQFVKNYKLEVSNVPDFSSIVFSLETENESTILDTLKEGKYFWRVISKTGFPDSPQKISSVRSFTIRKEEPSLTLEKQEDKKKDEPKVNPNIVTKLSTPKYNEEVREKPVVFSWNIQPPQEVVLEISPSSDFQTITQTHRIKGTFSKGLSFPPGTYFWRLRIPVSDTENYFSDSSGFTVIPIPTPHIYSPEHRSKIDILTEKEIVFRWSKLNGAKSYRVEVLRNGKKRIFKKELSDTELTFDNFTLLKPGAYTLKVTANLLQPDGSSEPSKIASSKFTIYLSKKIAKEDIEFKTPEDVFIE
jgi:hypothetical protein